MAGLVIGSSCNGAAQVSNNAIPAVVVSPAIETKPQDVSVCDLKDDPAKNNHVLVKLSGYFSRGFEDSNLYDPSCKSEQWIWVEIGGRRSVGVMYCCGVAPKDTRDEDLQVEGLKLPFVEDDKFKAFDKLFDKKGTGRAKATVIGTYFSGEKTQWSKTAPVYYGGYGHMGMASLFVVQQVLSSERSKIENK